MHDARGVRYALFVDSDILQGEARKYGKVRCKEVGVVLWRNPDRVVGADALFIANPSLPVPVLVVEVRSKNDTQSETMCKVRDYLTAGVRVVWVADMEKRIVTEHRRGQEPEVFTGADMLTIEEIIPGCLLPVNDVFVL